MPKAPWKLNLILGSLGGLCVLLVVYAIEYFVELSDAAFAAMGVPFGVLGAVVLALIGRPAAPGPEQRLRLTRGFMANLVQAARHGEVTISPSPGGGTAEPTRPLMRNALVLLLFTALAALGIVALDALGVEVPGAMYSLATAYMTALGTAVLRLIEPDPPAPPDEEIEVPLSIAEEMLASAVKHRQHATSTAG